MKIYFTFIKTAIVLNLFGGKSLLCSPGKAHQRFREKPMGVLVAEGYDVELRCAIDDQQGKVQWAKDGFALGFERPVPGYPRYYYHGDASIGEHHLIITGVALEDDGEYQCQVGPTEDEEPIWAPANVSVLVAPTSISIVGWNDGDTVGVESDTSLVLECLVENARPAPRVTWYKDGVLVDSSQQEDSIEDCIEPRLKSTRSRFPLMVTSEADGEQVSCRGHHPALKDALTALVASITISVLHPPQPPIITGYTEGTTLMAGDIVSVSCRSSGGVPRPSVKWYRQGILVDESWRDEDEFVVNDFARLLTPKEDGVILTCEVSNAVNKDPFEISIVLSVLYPPASVTIETPPFVSIGEHLRLVCRAAPSNPKSQIRWKIEGAELSKLRFFTKEIRVWITQCLPSFLRLCVSGRNFDVNSTLVERLPKSGWVSSSIISNYIVTENTSRDGSRVTVICEAISPVLHHVVTSEVVVDIVKAPEPPLLDGVSREVEKGTKLSISCYSRGGNPPPTMKLFKGDQMLESDLRSHQNVSEIFSEIRVDESDNGKVILCQLLHPAHQIPLDTSVRLDVHYAPSYISVAPTSSSVHEGDVVTFVCETSASNPPAKISWYSDGELIREELNILHRTGDDGHSTRSEFSMEANAADDGRNFSCEASNGLELPIHANVTLSVMHSPVWIVVPEPRITVAEGQNLTIETKASANPKPLKYEWRKDDTVLPVTSSTLHFPTVSRHDTGLYDLKALNPTGTANMSFILNVQYPPEVNIDAANLTMKVNEEGSIICSAEGNPSPKVEWFSFYSNQSLASGITSAIFRIDQAKLEDAGTVLCVASNGIGKAVQKKIRIFIEHGATILGPSGLSLSVHGTTAYVLCHARGFPEPRFQWSTSSLEISTREFHSFEIQEMRIVDEINLWLSILNVSNYLFHERETFKCAAINTLGEDFREIRLDFPNQHPSLVDLEITNISQESVSFSWNFDGGSGEIAFFVLVIFNLQDHSHKITQILNETTATVSGLLPASLNMAVLYASKENGFRLEVADSIVISVVTDQNMGELNLDPNTLIIGGVKIPRLVLLITTLSGISLLVVNIAIITCYLRTKKEPKKDSCMKCFGTDSLDASEVKSLSSDVYFPTKKDNMITHVNSSSSLNETPEQLTEPMFHQRRLSLSDLSSVSSASLKQSLKGSLRINESPILQGRKAAVDSEEKSYNKIPFAFAEMNLFEEKSLIPDAESKLEANKSPSHHIIQSSFTASTIYPPKSFTESSSMQQTCMESQGTHYPLIFPKDRIFPDNKLSPNISLLSPYTKGRNNYALPYLHQQRETLTLPDRLNPYAEQLTTKPKYTTLNLASLCEIGQPSCDHRCYNSRVCPECACKCPLAKNAEIYETLKQRRNISLYTSSLPRYFKPSLAPPNHYNLNYYCEDCCCQGVGMKPAYSSLELCNLNNAKLPRPQYTSRPFYLRSHSLDQPYPYSHKEITREDRIQRFNVTAPFEDMDSTGGRSHTNTVRDPLSYSENFKSDPFVSGNTVLESEVNISKPLSNASHPRTKSQPRVTFVLSENSDEGESGERNSPQNIDGELVEPLDTQWNVNGKAKSFSDGEETTMSSSESTSSTIEQKFQSYFRHNSLTRGEKRFKRTKN